MILAYPSPCISQQQDVDVDLNRRVNYKVGNLEKAREAIAIAKKLGVETKAEVAFEKFDRFDIPRTKQLMSSLEMTINPSQSPVFQSDVITSGFIRCDFKYPAGTDMSV